MKVIKLITMVITLTLLLTMSCTGSPETAVPPPQTAPEEGAPALITAPETTPTPNPETTINPAPTPSVTPTPSPTPTPVPEPAPAPTQITLGSAVQIHQDAVETALTRAKTDSYYKYGIYASRILAVKHPEIYLQADGLFLEAIETNIGFKKSYEITDVRDEYLYPQKAGGAMSGPPFSLDY
ncbi:hypothetical protein ACFLX0_03560, partial [Chloroflexota bacterium]